MSNYKAGCPCTVCGIEGEGLVCYHHVLTRKAYPEYAEKVWNKMPLCRLHHNMIHDIHTNRMIEKYSKVKYWLIDNRWRFDDFKKKWVKPAKKEDTHESGLQDH